jgi:hypothetical protein
MLWNDTTSFNDAKTADVLYCSTSERMEIVKNIFPHYDFKRDRTLLEGCAGYYLALLCYEKMPKNFSPTIKKAQLCLRLAWLCNDLNEECPNHNYDFIAQKFYRKALFFYQEALEWYNKMKPTTLTDEQAVVAQLQVYKQAAEKGAMFDARCFNIPKEEVTNLLYWRQVDAARNSIQMVARAYFSHAECQDKNTTDLQEMLFQKHGINWNDYPVNLKRGACCSKVWNFKNGEGMRSEWKVDYNIPMFKNEGRDYVERLIQPEEE